MFQKQGSSRGKLSQGHALPSVNGLHSRLSPNSALGFIFCKYRLDEVTPRIDLSESFSLRNSNPTVVTFGVPSTGSKQRLRVFPTIPHSCAPGSLAQAVSLRVSLLYVCRALLPHTFRVHSRLCFSRVFKHPLTEEVRRAADI